MQKLLEEEIARSKSRFDRISSIDWQAQALNSNSIGTLSLAWSEINKLKQKV